jgi:acyl-CoA reductase-like NAD-dependent aldehyde dehydrogenase
MHGVLQQVLKAQGLPAGLIGMVQGAANEVGTQLIRHPLIAAGAFTGSTRGGAALQAEANARPRPIPFYGELGSVNPLVALPAVLAAKGPSWPPPWRALSAWAAGSSAPAPA